MADSPAKSIAIARPDTGEAEWHAVKECFDSGWLAQGPKVKAFENAFAQKHHSQHGVAVSSATAGLHLALLALNIGPGDEVIVPSFSWVASANVVVQTGATPIFADVDLDTYNIDPSSVAQCLSKKTKAIMVVHLFGLCADVDAIKTLAPNVPIIEDAACAAGSTYKGKPAGSLGDIAVFSFHARKVLTTGEGGMICTDNKEYAQKMRSLRNHGAGALEENRLSSAKPYEFLPYKNFGFNYRMTDIQAAVGLIQLEKLDQMISHRKTLASMYNKELGNTSWLSCPQTPKNYEHSWQAYVCKVDTQHGPASKLMESLQNKGISTRPGTLAIHMLDVYKKTFTLSDSDCPNANTLSKQSIALPLHTFLSTQNLLMIAETIKFL